jgi:chaperonin GroES
VKIQPLHDRVIVERVAEDDRAMGSVIVLPDFAKEKPLRGVVLAAGPGRIEKNGNVIPLGVKTGDHVLFSKYAGTDIKIDGSDYLVMREEEILGVFLPEPGSHSVRTNEKRTVRRTMR